MCAEIAEAAGLATSGVTVLAECLERTDATAGEPALAPRVLGFRETSDGARSLVKGKAVWIMSPPQYSPPQRKEEKEKVVRYHI